MKRYNVGLPFERIDIVVASPFPETKKGNKFILVVMNDFSKWSEVFVVTDQEVTTVPRT